MQEYEYDDIYISEEQPSVEIEETTEEIDITEIDTYTIDISEAFPSFSSDANLNHALLNNRELQDQHPISAITGLRDELNEIESLKVVYSNEKNQANYYLWEDGNIDKENRVGHFVALCPADNTVKLCTENEDIFGVVVTIAGFVGGQSDATRGNNYALVAHSGAVAVRCETSVDVGDRIVPNGYGLAKKAESGYGYRVVALENIYGVDFAIINLDVPISQINDLMIEFDLFDNRLGEAEINIVSAINMANSAYNKSSSADSVSEEAVKKALEALLKADDVLLKTDELEEITSAVNQTATQAKAIAETAVVSAEAIRGEAVITANQSLTSVNELIADLEPITQWESIDPVTGETNVGAEYLTTYIKEGVATKAEIQTVETMTEENLSLIEQNANSIQTMVSSIDKYSVGEYSQSYGLSREQAKSILKADMVYIPTTHKDTRSHGETFIGEKNPEEFTPGYYYIWNGEDWEESASPLVAFFSEEPAPSRVLKYWYIDSNSAPNGYEPYALYIWKDDQWKKVNILDGNVSNRIVSMIRQSADEISIEVVNARGSAASLNERITSTEATVESVASWSGGAEDRYNLATIKQSASDEGANLALVVIDQDGASVVNGASIVLGANDNNSYLSFNADYINFKGKTLDLESQEFTITAKDGFRLDENGITWGANGGPLQILYSSELIAQPVNGAKYSNFPDSSTTGWHKIFVNGDKYATDTGDGGTTWTNPRQIVGEDGKTVELTQDNVFNALTRNGTIKGMVRDESTGELYINADYINAGMIKADHIDVAGVITAGSAQIGDIVADTIDATSITADALTIYKQDGESALFDAQGNSVIIGGFTVDFMSMFSNGKYTYDSDTSGVYIGTDGIGLGENKFYVTSKGYLKSTYGEIGGWSLTSYGFFSADYTNGIPTIGFGSSMGYKTNNTSQQQVVFYVGPTNVNGPEELINADFMVTKNSEVYAKQIYLGDNVDIDSNGLYIRESNMGTVASVAANITPTGSSFNSISVRDDLDPETHNSCSLGSSNLRWSNVYTSALNVSGGATISGSLSVGSFNPSSISTNSLNPSGVTPTIGNNTSPWGSCHIAQGNFTKINAGAGSGNDTTVIEIDCPSSQIRSVLPSRDGNTSGTQGVYLGNSDYRWLGVHTIYLNGNNVSATSLTSETSYMASSPIETSDANAKNSIELMNDKYSDIFDDLKPVSFKFNDGESGRTHTGLIAQDVKETLEKFNISTSDFAAYCSWEKEDGTETSGLRYEEFISMCIYEIQKLKDRVAELENTVGALYN